MANNYPPEIQKRIKEIHSNFDELIDKANKFEIKLGGFLSEKTKQDIKINHIVELLAITMIGHEKLLAALKNNTPADMPGKENLNE